MLGCIDDVVCACWNDATGHTGKQKCACQGPISWFMGAWGNAPAYAPSTVVEDLHCKGNGRPGAPISSLSIIELCA